VAEWKKDLDNFFAERARKTPEQQQLEARHAEAAKFFNRAVIPAFEDLGKELQKHGRTVRVMPEKDHVSFRVRHEDVEEYRCELRVRIGPRTVVPYVVRHFFDKKAKRHRRAEVPLREGPKLYTVSDFSKIDLLRFVVADYKKYVL